MLRLFRGMGSLSWSMLLTMSLATAMMFSGCSKPAESEKADGGKAATAKDAKSDDKAASQSTANKLDSGRAVLKAMATAYRQAKSYQDNGTVRLTAQSGDKKIDEKHDYSVAFERPNKIHLDVYAAQVRCDGKKYHAFVKDLPGQVIEKDAPEKLNVKSVYCDPILMKAMSLGGPAGAPPQPLLLLEDKALEILLGGAEEPNLSEPGEIDGHKCHRVQIRRPEGAVVFWIDQESYVLRRIVLATDALRPFLSQRLGGEIENSSLIAEFTGAELNRPVNSVAFEFEIPPGEQVQRVKYLLPPYPGQMVGKKAPPFKFTDDAGQSITPESLAGKIAVMLFWSPQNDEYSQSLLTLQKLHDAYQKNDKVAIFAVCLDGDRLDKKAMEEMRRTANLQLPIYRDVEKNTPDYKFFDVVFILGPDGTMQDYELVSDANLAETLQKKIDDLATGKSLVEEALVRYQKELKDYEKAVEGFASSEAQPLPAEKIAERSEPKTFKLKPLWKCADLKDPGNILVINEPKRAPRLLVVSPPNLVAEVGLDGKVSAQHKLNLAGGELVTNLRAFTTAAGKTYVAAFASGQQRLHLFDLEEKQHLSYPQDALQNPHSGIADVELYDLDGDGTPEIYVGYWGVVGVHGVALDGKRLWGNRSLANVARIAAAPADKSGGRNLICMNILSEQNTSLAVLNAQGQGQGEFTVGKRSLRSILGTDLAGDGNPQWCALGVTGEGELLALGFNLEGRELWSYRLPSEAPTRPIEPIIAGRVTRGGHSQWILPSPDGSIQILAADGKPIDHFNFGAVLQGMATTEISGKPALLIASPNGLEAFAIE